MSTLHPKQAIFLIDDMACPRSGWDRDFRGAEHYPVKEWGRHVYVKRVNTKYPSTVTREITRQTYGEVTFETSYKLISGDGLYMAFYDKAQEAFRIDIIGNVAYAKNKKLFTTSSAPHHIKFVLNIDTATVKIIHDGKLCSVVPFTGSACAFDRVSFGYENEYLGHADFQCCKMYKNYLVNDYIIAAYDGELPEDYIVEKEGKASVLRKQYGFLSYNYVYDVQASKNAKVFITHPFDRTSGKVSLELKYVVTKKNGCVKISLLGNDKKVITLTDCGSALCHGENVLRKHSPYTVFQTLRIDADTDNCTALIYLNGKKITYLDFDEVSDFIDGFKVEFEAYDTASQLMLGEIFANILLPEPADYVPEPVVPKKKGEHYVGMNICSLWREGQHHGWDCITPFEDHKPLVGFYDEGIPEVADWEIKFMCEHGIDFQLYCWYASEINKPMMNPRLNYQWNTAHMYAKYSDKVKFALLWEAACHKPDSIESFKKYYVPYWIDYYFSDPRYMQIDGLAVMSIYGIQKLIDHMGSIENLKICFDYLRAEIKKLGYKGLILMACGDPTPQFLELGVDATHAYNWSHNGYDLEYTKQRNLQNINKGLCHQVPTVSSGYNLVAWRNKRTPNMTPEDLQTALTWIRDDILPTFDKKSWKSKLTMLSTWNEYGEGTYMSPSGLNRFGYLDAVRNVFCEDMPHTDIVPTEKQQESYCLLHPKDRYFLMPFLYKQGVRPGNGVYRKYEFKTQSDLDKWEFTNVTDLHIKNGVLCGTCTDFFPVMRLKEASSNPVYTGKVSTIKVKHRGYKNQGDMCLFQVGFTENENINSRRIYITAFTTPEKISEFSLSHRNIYPKVLSNQFYNLDFRPLFAKGYFELESIEFMDTESKYDLFLDGEYASLDYALMEIDGELYIPFDTENKITRQINMFYKWYKAEKQLVIDTDKRYVLTIDSNIVTSDDETITLKRNIELYDGLPLLPLSLYAKILGRSQTFDGYKINLDLIK